MGPVNLVEHRNFIIDADTGTGRGPYADPIQGQDSSLLERRRIKSARCMTLVMFGEEQAAGELLDSTADNALRELKRLRSLSEPQDSLTC